MASTREKQLEAARRKAKQKQRERLSAKRPLNTTSWVDERYAGQLAKRFKEVVLTSHENEYCSSLSKIVASPLFVDAIIENGKTGVYHIDNSLYSDTLLLCAPLWYDKKGKLIKQKQGATVAISDHALIRFFERMRTNSEWEVRKGIHNFKGLFEEPPVYTGQEKSLRVEGFGVVHCVSVHDPATQLGLRWLIKTFIGEVGIRKVIEASIKTSH